MDLFRLSFGSLFLAWASAVFSFCLYTLSLVVGAALRRIGDLDLAPPLMIESGIICRSSLGFYRMKVMIFIHLSSVVTHPVGFSGTELV